MFDIVKIDSIVGKIPSNHPEINFRVNNLHKCNIENSVIGAKRLRIRVDSGLLQIINEDDEVNNAIA